MSAARTVGVSRTGHCVLADAGDGGGEPADRVVPVDLGAVAGRAVRGELQPGGAALPRRDRVELQSGPGVEGEGAGLADALGAALEEFGVLVGEEAGAVRGAGLLVGGEGDHDVPAGPDPCAGPGPDDREDHRVHVLHVDGAAAPDDPVADLAGEGVHGPVVGLGGHHVEVAVDQQRVGATGRCPRSGRRRWCGPGCAPAGSGSMPASASRSAAYSAAGPLPAVAAAAVGGVDPDQLGGEAHHLVERQGVQYSLGRVHVSHTAPPPRPRRSS